MSFKTPKQFLILKNSDKITVHGESEKMAVRGGKKATKSCLRRHSSTRFVRPRNQKVKVVQGDIVRSTWVEETKKSETQEVGKVVAKDQEINPPAVNASVSFRAFGTIQACSSESSSLDDDYEEVFIAPQTIASGTNKDAHSAAKLEINSAISETEKAGKGYQKTGPTVFETDKQLVEKLETKGVANQSPSNSTDQSNLEGMSTTNRVRLTKYKIIKQLIDGEKVETTRGISPLFLRQIVHAPHSKNVSETKMLDKKIKELVTRKSPKSKDHCHLSAPN